MTTILPAQIETSPEILEALDALTLRLYANRYYRCEPRHAISRGMTITLQDCAQQRDIYLSVMGDSYWDKACAQELTANEMEDLHRTDLHRKTLQQQVHDELFEIREVA